MDNLDCPCLHCDFQDWHMNRKLEEDARHSDLHFRVRSWSLFCRGRRKNLGAAVTELERDISQDQ